MPPFVWDEDAQEKVAKMRAYAEANPISPERMKRILEGLAPYPEDEPGHCCTLSCGIRLVFSIEIQSEIGACRHLATSVDVREHLPNPIFLEQEVMPALGFRDGFTNCHLSYHDIGENHRAADILEPMNEPRENT